MKTPTKMGFLVLFLCFSGCGDPSDTGDTDPVGDTWGSEDVELLDVEDPDVEAPANCPDGCDDGLLCTDDICDPDAGDADATVVKVALSALEATGTADARTVVGHKDNDGFFGEFEFVSQRTKVFFN